MFVYVTELVAVGQRATKADRLRTWSRGPDAF